MIQPVDQLKAKLREAEAEYARLMDELTALRGNDDPNVWRHQEALREDWRKAAGRVEAFGEAMAILGIDPE